MDTCCFPLGTSSAVTVAARGRERSPDGLDLTGHGRCRITESPSWDCGDRHGRARPTMDFMPRPFIGTHRASKRRWTSPQDSLHLTAAGMRQSTVGPLWDGLTSRSGTAHAGHHVQPPRRLAHLRAARLRCRFCYLQSMALAILVVHDSAHHPRSRRCNPAGLFGVR